MGRDRLEPDQALDLSRRDSARQRAGVVAFGVSMVGPVIYTFGVRRRRRNVSCRALSICATGGARASPSRAPAPTSRACAPTARRDDDGWVIYGQKTWTTIAQYADWIFVLARTDPAGEEAGGHLVLPCRHEDAGDHGAADPDHRRRPRGQRGLSSTTCAFPPTTSSARRTKAGTTPSSCSPTSATASPASASRRRGSTGARARLDRRLRRRAEDRRPRVPHEARGGRSRAQGARNDADARDLRPRTAGKPNPPRQC